MQNLKKISIKLLTISLITTSLGCITTPSKKDIEICLIDYPNDEVTCAITKGEGIKDADEATYNRVYGLIKHSSLANRQPLGNLDHGIAMKPSQWGILQNYIHDLEIALKTNCLVEENNGNP